MGWLRGPGVNISRSLKTSGGSYGYGKGDGTCRRREQMQIPAWRRWAPVKQEASSHARPIHNNTQAPPIGLPTRSRWSSRWINALWKRREHRAPVKNSQTASEKRSVWMSDVSAAISRPTDEVVRTDTSIAGLRRLYSSSGVRHHVCQTLAPPSCVEFLIAVYKWTFFFLWRWRG